MSLQITIPECPDETHEKAILAVLREHNERKAGPAGNELVAVLLTDETGQTVGGLWGRIYYDWMFIDMLVVPEGHRTGGYGSALMREADRIARIKGCVGMWLDTFEFQALGFYRKLGFELFGTIDDHPVGQRRFFLQKRLSAV